MVHLQVQLTAAPGTERVCGEMQLFDVPPLR